MNNEYNEFIKSIELSSIKIIESHEKVYFSPSDNQLLKVKVDTEHAYNQTDPQIREAELLNNHKYKFTFSVDDKVFFEAEYVLFIGFLIKDKSKIESLLQNEEIKKVFIEKQIDKMKLELDMIEHILA